MNSQDLDSPDSYRESRRLATAPPVGPGRPRRATTMISWTTMRRLALLIAAFTTTFPAYASGLSCLIRGQFR